MLKMNIWPRDLRQRRLLERARAGDSEAFRALFHELYDPLFAFAARRLASRQDAEDLVSKVLEQFLQRLDQYDPSKGSVRTWVFTLARNALIDFLRTRHPTAELAPVIETLADSNRSALEDLVRREELDGLARRVAALDPASQELITLRFGDGLSHAEIGTLLQASPATIRQRLSRALRELKQQMQRKTANAKGVEHVRIRET